MNALKRFTQGPRPATAVMPLAMLIFMTPTLPLVAIAAERALPRQAATNVDAAAIGAHTVVSPEAKQLAEWVAITGDHADAPFIIVDKKRATVLVFDPDARLRAHSAVLLGLALGDVSVPGIGTRPMEEILPAERTTPAGRFVAERGRNLRGEDIVWVDYDAAVSLHRVRAGKPVERRAQRLASPTIDDNRISYGCINVPVAFYDNFIEPIFAQRKAMVYVLPDVMRVDEVFGILQVSPTVSAAHNPGPDLVHGENGIGQ